MSKDPLARLAENQTWTAPIEEPLQSAVRAVLGGSGDKTRSLRNALHGTWLHEPLHAIITDIPIGSWTAAMVFDAAAAISGSTEMNSAADAAIVVGLVGAAGAAITGLNDWAETEGTPKRIGVVHGILNVAAMGLFATSWLGRRQGGPRTRARLLSALGYLMVSASAHLGGNLVYEHGVGVQEKQQHS